MEVITTHLGDSQGQDVGGEKTRTETKQMWERKQTLRNAEMSFKLRAVACSTRCEGDMRDIMYHSVIDFFKTATVGKLLWYKRNKALGVVLLSPKLPEVLISG